VAADYDKLSSRSVHDCKLRFIDTLGCALGAYDEPLSGMARAVAARTSGAPAARVWGSRIASTPEAAAFANGVMLRLMDISDTYLGKSRGHPSDVMAAVLAVADAERSSGKETIAALALAYDVYCSLCDARDWNSAGWDQPLYAVVGAAAGAGRLLRLDQERMCHAISLALAPNMAMYQTRKGQLSSWKGCAGANAARNAVFAAMLARDGFTGPEAVFEGEAGLYANVGRADWTLPPAGSMISETHIKSLPVCYHGQSAVLAAMRMHARTPVDQITAIHVEAYRTAVDMMGKDPSRWAPATHETADHSLPYTVAIALLDGEVTPASFDHARFTDPGVVDLMRKTTVGEDAGFTRAYPDAAPGRVTITLKSGQVERGEMMYPTGHARSPMSDSEVERKFRGMLASHPAASRCDEILQRLWSLEKVGDVGEEVIAALAS
jgi:2-methylcitrate dehydratase